MKTLILLLLFSQPLFAYLPNSGDEAPNFTITQADGTPFKLSDYKGKKSVYVVFWNTWCHFCMKKIPKLKAIEQNFAADIKIIAVNTGRDDSIAEMKQLQQYRVLNYALAFDAQQKITDLYNVHGVPTEFIIDINGTIIHRDGVPENIKDHLQQWNTKKP